MATTKRKRVGAVVLNEEAEVSAPAEIKALLSDQGINVSITKAASTLRDMDARGLTEMVRASVHYYNTEDEIDRLIEALS